MAGNVLRSPIAAEDAAARAAEEMMIGWDQVGPWYSRGTFWLGVLVVSVVFIVIVVESLAAGAGI